MPLAAPAPCWGTMWVSSFTIVVISITTTMLPTSAKAPVISDLAHMRHAAGAYDDDNDAVDKRHVKESPTCEFHSIGGAEELSKFVMWCH